MEEKETGGETFLFMYPYALLVFVFFILFYYWIRFLTSLAGVPGNTGEGEGGAARRLTITTYVCMYVCKLANPGFKWLQLIFTGYDMNFMIIQQGGMG